MRELFVYYRVAAQDAEQALVAVIGMQARLRLAHVQLRARLLRRPEEAAGMQTWMETYSTDPATTPSGVDMELQAAIERAALALAPSLIGARHTEVFVSCAS